MEKKNDGLMRKFDEKLNEVCKKIQSYKRYASKTDRQISRVKIKAYENNSLSSLKINPVHHCFKLDSLVKESTSRYRK